MLGMMAQQRPVMLVPQNHERTTQEAAAFLNISRPFVIKEVEAARLKCHKVGRHRRIELTERRRYQGARRLESEKACRSWPTCRKTSTWATDGPARRGTRALAALH
ncbi:MAG: helix-turn-helix domain-containing protein [Burkholderiales bacterium]